MVEWSLKNKAVLEKYELCGTGTTSKRIADATGLNVKGYLSGPLGGDQQIGALVAEGKIDLVVFFCDPLTAQPHDPDVKALLRIANVYNVPIVTNVATADLVINSLN
jgi:methylglyoxal synthase